MYTKLTMVIPTYCRQVLLARLLDYLSEMQLACKVVVADSSPDETAAVNQASVHTVQPKLDITYTHYETTIRVEEKIARAVDTVDTPYVVLCADDDFLIPRGLAACVEVLDSHPAYAVASGRTIAIIQPGGEDDMFSTLAEEWYTRSYPQRTIDNATPVERLLAHMRSYTTTFYAVHRQPNFAHNLHLATHATSDVRFSEILLSCLNMIQGKAYCLDQLVMVRQFLPNSASQQADSWATLLTSDDFSERYRLFRTCLNDELVAVAGLDHTQATEVVNQAFHAYLPGALGCSPQYSTSAHQVLSYMVKAFGVVRHMAGSVLHEGGWETLRSPQVLYRQARVRHILHTDPLSLLYVLNPSSPYYADFLPVYRRVVGEG